MTLPIRLVTLSGLRSCLSVLCNSAHLQVFDWAKAVVHAGGGFGNISSDFHNPTWFGIVVSPIQLKSVAFGLAAFSIKRLGSMQDVTCAYITIELS